MKELVLGGLLFVGLGVTIACNSVASTPSFGIVGSAGPIAAVPPGRASQPASFDAPCPGYTPPIAGASCSDIIGTPSWDRTCEYGHDLDRDCNDVFECNGRWRRNTQSSCNGRCPDTIDKIVPGSRCDDSMGCSYLEGTCACVLDAFEDDGGTDDGGQVPNVSHWHCAPSPKDGCPAQRPPLGSDCVRPMTCDYGSCTISRDVTYACEGRIWVQGDSPDCSK